MFFKFASCKLVSKGGSGDENGAHGSTTCNYCACPECYLTTKGYKIDLPDIDEGFIRPGYVSENS